MQTVPPRTATPRTPPRRAFGAATPPPPAESREPTHASDAYLDAPLSFDWDWEFKQELRSAERLLQSVHACRVDSAMPRFTGNAGRPNGGVPAGAPRHPNRTSAPTLERPTARVPTSKLARTALACGVALGLVGGLFVGRSIQTGQLIWWARGLPSILGGQLLLSLGLLAQLSFLRRLYQSSATRIALLEVQLDAAHQRLEASRGSSQEFKPSEIGLGN